jgi:hypothetical protein
MFRDHGGGSISRSGWSVGAVGALERRGQETDPGGILRAERDRVGGGAPARHLATTAARASGLALCRHGAAVHTTVPLGAPAHDQRLKALRGRPHPTMRAKDSLSSAAGN